MQFTKASLGVKIALASGLVMFLNLFLPWFSEQGANINVASSLFAWFIALVGLLAVGILVSGFSIGAFKAEHLTIVVGGVAFILALVKTIIGHEIMGFKMGYHIGIFLALFACAAVTAGAVLDMLQKKLPFPGIQTGGGLPPPPPPPPQA